jgi:hypothetical protein
MGDSSSGKLGGWCFQYLASYFAIEYVTFKRAAWLGLLETLVCVDPHFFLCAFLFIYLHLLGDDSKTGDFQKIVEDFAGKIEAHLFQTNSTFLTQVFSAADVCASVWLALTMVKLGSTKVPQQTYRWIMTTLNAVQPFCKSEITPLVGALEEGAPSPASKSSVVAAASAPVAVAPVAVAAPAPVVVAAPVAVAAPAPVPVAAPVAVAAPAPVAAPAASAPIPAAASGDFADNSLVQKMAGYGLEYTIYSHAPCMTAEELVANVPLASPKETHTKNLLFKDKKHGLFLVTHATASTFNTKQLGKLLNLQGKVNMRLADEALLDKHLQVKPGCVGPLCIVNDSSKEVTLVLDKALMDYDYIHSHPLQNDASMKISPAVLKEYMSKAGVEPVVVDFGIDAGAADAGGKAPANRPAEAKAPKQKKEKSEDGEQKKSNNKKTTKKGETLLALQWKKDENFPGWYSDVIVLSEMISYYDISGCYILRPWSYKIWDLMQQWFNAEVRKNIGPYALLDLVYLGIEFSLIFFFLRL